MHEIAQMGESENPTDEALEASENKMFSLAALLKTIGTVRHSRWINDISDAR